MSFVIIDTLCQPAAKKMTTLVLSPYQSLRSFLGEVAVTDMTEVNMRHDDTMQMKKTAFSIR